MKGVSLPINTIVIVAIAVLVLMVIGGFFAVNVGSGVNAIELNSAISSACNTFVVAYNCDISQIHFATAQFKKSGDSTETSIGLDELCDQANLGNDICIVTKCGCSAPRGTGGGTTTTMAASDKASSSECSGSAQQICIPPAPKESDTPPAVGLVNQICVGGRWVCP